MNPDTHNQGRQARTLERHIIASGGAGERTIGHQPTVGTIAGEKWFVWTELTDGAERLVARRCGFDGTVPISPVGGFVYAPLVADPFVLWSQRTEDGDWPLWTRAIERGRLGAARQLSRKGVRVRSGHAACSRRGELWVVYEERIGKRTWIKAARFDGGNWQTDLPVTSGEFNAYDPQIAFDHAQRPVIVFGGFRWGNYHIFVQPLEGGGKPRTEPQLVSNQDGIGCWPSLCRRADGGMWVAWTAFDAIRLRKTESTFVRHYRYKAREKIFDSYSRLYAGVWDEGRLLAPFAPRNVAGTGVVLDQGPMAALRVGDSVCGKYPAILEDANGAVHIVYRKHRNRADGADKDYLNPDISITTLQADGWSDSEQLLAEAGWEGPVALEVNGSEVCLAFTEDKRPAGGERLDRSSQLSVGYLRLDFSATERSGNHLVPYVLSATPTPSIEEEPFHPQAGPYRLALGQTHCHTNLSICNRIGDGSIDLNYRFFQDVQHSDFGAITDHCLDHGPLEEHLVRKAAAFYYFPGEFVALPAYEWTGSGQDCLREGGPFGHVNVISFEENGELPFFSPRDPADPGNTLLKLWRQLPSDKKILTIPHHTADYIHFFNWDFYDARFAPVVEIYQDRRGSHEQDAVVGSIAYYKREQRGAWVVDALRRGLKLGFIGGGDHFGMARAGLLVTALTRHGLYEALVARRCFATTGLSLSVVFKANASLMGEVVTGGPVGFELAVESPVPVREIQIVRNGETCDTKAVNATHEVLRWSSERPARDWWYCRAITVTGEMAWTSPIWVQTAL